VRNITPNAAIGRVKIVIKTDDSADPVVVRDLIAARLNGHPSVLKEPAASVYLTDVRDGALEFTSFAFVASPRQVYRTKSELLFQIVPDLKAKGIGLANSTPVVNVGLGERTIEPTP
jgi:small-conductance mechanosensitive channel